MKGRKGRATSFAHGNLVRYFRYVRTTSIRSAAPLAFSGFCSRRIDNVMTDVILKKLRGQPVHGTSHRGNQHQHISTAELCFQRALDGLDLSPDASDPADELRPVLDRIRHRYNIGGYPIVIKTDCWKECWRRVVPECPVFSRIWSSKAGSMRAAFSPPLIKASIKASIQARKRQSRRSPQSYPACLTIIREKRRPSGWRDGCI